MNRKRRWLYSLCVGLTACSAAFSHDLLAKDGQEDFLAAVSSLHGITEEDAINRLAAESEAAADYRLVRGLGLDGYAGAWFDEEAERLVVATSSESDRSTLSAHNIDSVQVERDLRALEVLAAEVFEDINYLCTLFDFESQGTNSFHWTSNTGNSSTSSTLAGTCTPGAPVQVNLEVTNPYGATLEQYAFSCPN